MIAHPFLSGAGSPPPGLASVALPGVPLYARGKIREMYDLGEHLLMVATDRVSAFDVVLDLPVPGKGMVLTALTQFWFEKLGAIQPNHLVSGDPACWPDVVQPFADLLRGRALLVRRCRRINVECVVRGYLAGGGWAEYQCQGTLADVPLPFGLLEAEKLPEPRFTPSLKAEVGQHDEAISVDEMEQMLGTELARELERRSLRLYEMAEAAARERGIILADTKFEFGLLEAEIVQIDECLTPDSSRFWLADRWQPGATPPSLDKQPLRDYLEQTGWDKRPPPPPVPAEVLLDTSARYAEAFRRLTGPKL